MSAYVDQVHNVEWKTTREKNPPRGIFLHPCHWSTVTTTLDKVFSPKTTLHAFSSRSSELWHSPQQQQWLLWPRNAAHNVHVAKMLLEMHTFKGCTGGYTKHRRVIFQGRSAPLVCSFQSALQSRYALGHLYWGEINRRVSLGKMTKKKYLEA